MHRLILHNDEIQESSRAALAVGQVGALSGWGVFSTLRVVEGVPFAWERHWERMRRDARVLHVPLPPDSEYVRSRLMRLIEANQARNATLRVAALRNGGGVWQGPVEREFDLVAMTADLKDWGGGVRLAVHAQARHAASPFRGVKSLSWAANLTMLEEAQQAGYDETILLNERNEVSECTSANIFIAEGTRVWTPPLDSGCLPGVTREILLGEARAPGWEVAEKPFGLEELERADQVFITSTTRDLLPVLSVQGRPLRQEGGARMALQEAFGRYVEAYVAQHAPPADR